MLAENVPDQPQLGGKALTLENADSFNVFATMVYLPGVTWVN